MGITASTRECFRHFRESTPVPVLVDLFQSRFKIPRSTLTDWTSNDIFPKGLRLLQMQTLLVEHGYTPLELEKLSEVLKRTRVFIAESKLEFSDIRDALKLKQNSSARRILMGASGLNDRDEKILEQLINSKFGAKQSSHRVTVVPRKANKHGSIEAHVDVREIPEPRGVHSHMQVITSATALVQSLRPLAELIAGDSFTRDERVLFRDLVGEGGIQALRVSIGMLVSEKSRQLIIEKQQEEQKR